MVIIVAVQIPLQSTVTEDKVILKALMSRSTVLQGLKYASTQTPANRERYAVVIHLG